MNLFYNNFKGYWVKAEMVCTGAGDIEDVTSPCLSHKNFNRAHIETKFREGLSNRQIDMMSAWTIKYTLRVSLKISGQRSIYMGVISAKYSFISLFLHFQLNWDMKCILIG